MSAIEIVNAGIATRRIQLNETFDMVCSFLDLLFSIQTRRKNHATWITL